MQRQVVCHKSFDFTLLLSISSKSAKLNTCQDCLNVHFVLSTSISKHKMLRSWNVDRLRWVHIRLSRRKRIMINACNFTNELQYVTYCIISRSKKNILYHLASSEVIVVSHNSEHSCYLWCHLNKIWEHQYGSNQ